MSKSRMLVSVAAVVLLAAAAAPVAAQSSNGSGVVVEAPRQVTGGPDPLRLFSIPALAVHPDDPATVVMAVGDSRNGGCGLRVSRDGGLSWATAVPDLLPDDADFCYQRPLFPVMAPAFASDGTLYVAMPASSTETGHPNGPIDMLVARTDDLGQTVETVTVAEGGRVTVDPADFGQEGEPGQALIWHKAPSLAVDPNDPDKVYLGMRWNVWGTDLQPFPGDVPFRPYVVTSEDGGETWGEPTDIVANAGGEEVYGALNHDLVVAPDGTVYSFSRETPAPVAAGETPPDRRLLMFKSSDGGQTWETVVFLDDVENFSAPYAGVDPRNGNLYVVYGAPSPEAPEDGPAPEEIFFSGSDDGGETWSAPVQITDDSDAPDTLGESTEAGISVAPNGRIDVAWHDFRNDPFGQAAATGGHAVEQRYWDVYYSHSSDGGESWSPNTRVTKTFIDGGEGATFNNIDIRGPIGIASSDEAAYVAWPDARASTVDGEAEDAYFSRIRFGEPAELVTTSGGAGDANWLWSLLGAGAALIVASLLLIVGARRVRASAATASDRPSPAG